MYSLNFVSQNTITFQKLVGFQMSIEFSHDTKTGIVQFSYKRHIYIALGLLFVGSGLATFTGPWWQGILEALLGKVNVRVEPQYQWVISIIQVVIGLALVAYKHFMLDARQAKLDADRSTIKQSNLEIDLIRSYLSNLVDDHSYKSSLHSYFYKIHTQFIQPENSFQDADTARLYKQFHLCGQKLETFVGVNFFVFANNPSIDGDFRYCLAPHLNMDREMIFYDPKKVAEYNELKNELHKLANETSVSFSEFITILKTLRHI